MAVASESLLPGNLGRDRPFLTLDPLAAREFVVFVAVILLRGQTGRGLFSSGPLALDPGRQRPRVPPACSACPCLSPFLIRGVDTDFPSTLRRYQEPTREAALPPSSNRPLSGDTIYDGG